MGIIRITDNDINRSKPPEEGWHLGKIEKFSESDSADKRSKNYVFDVPIIDPNDPCNGRYMFARFNSKAVGMFVSSGFLPGALDNPKITAMELDPEQLIGKEIYGLVTRDMYEGKIQMRTETWASASAPPF